MDDCLARLDALSSLQVIVPVGNTALTCLLGLSQISLRRGSIYPWQNIYGRGVKVIPTLHPAAILRDTTLEYRTVKDWERIAREIKRGSDVVYPERHFMLDPSEEFFWGWWSEVSERDTPLAIDIETNPREKKILCVGFAGSSDLGVSLSWTREHKTWIKQVCALSQPKILQNGLYDLYWLRMYGIEVKNYCYDTLAMSHLLRANEKHSLAFLTSISTDEPYYKGGEDPDDEKVWEGKDWYKLLEYNARDCMVTYEVGWERLWPLVQDRGLIGKYFDYYQSLYAPLLDLMTHGVNVDQEMMGETYEATQAAATQAMAQAQALVGTQLFTFKTKGEAALYAQRVLGEDSEQIQKAVARLRTPLEQVWAGILDRGISDKVLARLLYNQWQLPTQKHRKTGSTTTDENALRKLLQKVEKRGDHLKSQFLRAVLQHRHQRKLAEFYSPARLDEDGRMRCEYSYNTRPGRLNSKKNPMGGGTNLQNQSRKVRGMFIPDKDCLMCEIDLSQIQARFVYVMAYQVTGDVSLLRLATMHPSDGDIHTESAAQMFHCTPEQVTKEQRYKGKVTEHASNFGLQAEHLQEVFLKGEEGIAVSIQECQELLKRKFEAKPGILAWQRAIREEALREKKLTSTWGIELDLTYERPGEDLWRKCYAWKPQADEAKHLNLLGLVPTWRYIKEKGYKSKINLQCHDALVFSLRPSEAFDIVQFCVKSLEQVRNYYGVDLSIPCAIKVGKNWQGEHEWKSLPTEEAFMEVAKEVLDGP
jgi:DNA polymerase I-like protein with 3'-5' exonuclease and polymerase domains